MTGRNGAGKTTLLEILAGLRTLDAGKYYENFSKGKLFLGHRSGLSSNLTVQENIQFMMSVARDRDTNTAPLDKQALDYFNISAFSDIPVGYLSAGQKRKVLLTWFLLSQRSVYLLDEPYTSLDDTSCRALDSLILSKQASGSTVIFTSHTTPGILDFECLNLDGGRLASTAEL